MAGRYELYQGTSGDWRFRLKSGNGEVLATGEGYTSKSGALNGIDAVRRNADSVVVEVER